jgi:tubby-related protein 1
MKEKVIMQFGRRNDNVFAMDFNYPLSPLQAFSICLTAFDN